MTSMLSRSGYRRIAAIIVFGVVVLVAVWYVWQNVQEFRAYHWTLDLWSIGLAFAIYTLDLWLATVAWHAVCKLVLPEHHYWSGARIYAASLSFRRLPFGGIIGGGSRLYLYERLGYPWQQTAAGLAIEWSATVTAGGLLGLTYWIVQSSLPWLVKPCLIGTLIFLTMVVQPHVLSFAHRQAMRLASMKSSEPIPPTIRISRSQHSWIIALYLLVWTVGGILVFVVARAFTEVPNRAMLSVVGMWALAGTGGMVAVVLPSGLGIVELTLSIQLTSIIPVPAATGTAVAVRLLVTVAETVWTLIAWRANLKSRIAAAFNDRVY